MQLTLVLTSATTALELERAIEAARVFCGQAQAVRSGGQVVADAVARAEADKLAALEAENPQFGRQPLPPGAVLVGDGSGEALPPFDATAERTAGPLAPPAAPSPAAVEASASVPAAAPASIPPPPPAASAVPSPSPAAATPAPAAAVDAKGLPWDERIHASSRAKIADGSWRMKRGVQSHVIETVEAELRAQMGFVGQSGSTVAFDAAPANGASVPPPPAAPAPLPPGPPALTFGIVASRIGKAVTAGTLSGNVLSVKLAELGFPDGLHTVNSRPDMWQKILDTLGA